MSKSYRVPVTVKGYVYVEADSPKEAKETLDCLSMSELLGRAFDSFSDKVKYGKPEVA